MNNYTFQKQTPNCVANANKYAKDQGTFYDETTNKMLYGMSNNLRVTGVSDGTLNQINPLMLKQMGAGVAGANPCYNDNNQYIEPFCNSNLNINHYIGITFLGLILILVVMINMNESNNKL